MADENNDLNTDQVVTDPDLNSADAVDQQGLTDQVAGDQTQDVLADGTTKDKTVKYEELEKAVQGRKAAEEQAAYSQRQLELYQQNAAQTQQAPVQASPTDPMEIAMQKLGLEADDLYGENILKVNKMARKIETYKTQQTQTAMSTQQFAMAHPDINEVVGSVNLATGMIIAPTAELLALAAKKPYLNNATTPEIYEAVLQERQFAEMQKNVAINTEFQQRRNADTKTGPLAGSAAGGGGGSGSQGNQQLMTREQVRETERKLAAGEI